MTNIYLYASNIADFIKSIQNRTLTPLLEEEFIKKFGESTSASEVASWRNSLKALAEILKRASIKNSYIFLEFTMPLVSRRCDVILVGHGKDGRPNAVVIELKQWNYTKSSAVMETVVAYGSNHLHPSAQVRNYCQYLKYYHEAFTEGTLDIYGCAYLHNLTDSRSIDFLNDSAAFGILPKEYLLFDATSKDRLVEWLEDKLERGNGSLLADKLIYGQIRPSTKLLDVVVQAIKNNFEWRLLDEQQLVFNTIVSKVKAAQKSSEKSVIIVRGGPGTGKSILAIQLLAYAARNYWRIAHTTGSKAFRVVLQALTQSFADGLLKRVYNAKQFNQIPVRDLFTLSMDIAKVGAKDGNAFDLVVYDEAHRLWDYRRQIFVNMNKQLSDTPMVQEVINASKVTAFFLDDNQAVRANEIGTVEYIKDHTERLGINPEIIDLNIQFRCAGSKDYTDWVDFTLDFGGINSTLWRLLEGYDFQIVNSMQEMQTKLEQHKKAKYKCRFLAGFCWSWHRNQAGIHHDIADKRFDGWSAPWIENTNQENSKNVLTHTYYKWATDDSYFNQVGSIYSVQGFEFDYIGLIFGEDLVIRNGKWVADLSRNRDKQFKRDLMRDKQSDPLEKLRSIYRVLLTRGMRGTYIFFLDPETKEYFETLLNRE